MWPNLPAVPERLTSKAHPPEDVHVSAITARIAACLFASLCLLAGACATEADLAVAPDDGEVTIDTDELDEEMGDDKIDPEAGFEGDDESDLAPADVVEAALADVEEFWEQAYPQVYGSSLEPLAGYYSYGPDTPRSELPPCEEGLTYEDIASNAFYCPPRDLIAWDVPGLIEPLYDRFGAFTIAIVMAHEFGHAIQERAGISGDTILLEQQADCFAGAWAARVNSGASEHFQVEIDDLDQAVAGFLELRDGIDTSAGDPLAHGSGFDRVAAFQDGFEQGVARCAEYPDLYERRELVIVQMPFLPGSEDERNRGNLDRETLLPLALAHLDAFFEQLLAEQGEQWPPVGDDVLLYDPATDDVSCGEETFTQVEAEFGSFYCVPDDVVALDIENLGNDLYEIGDFALVTELARLYALRAQAVLDIEADPTAEALHADCLTGIYAGAAFLGTIEAPEEETLVLSPGDLDEAIIGFLAYGGRGGDEDDEDSATSAFARTDAFRDGFVEGIEGCDHILVG
jgi:predicted metalloprotease